MSNRGLAGLLAGCLVLVAACGGSSSGADGPVDPKADVTLTWWTGQPVEGQEALEALADEFHQLHPNVTIKVSPGAATTSELQRKLSAAFASGEYPDISYAYGSWASELAGSGRTLDITEKIRKPEVRWDEFPEVARATVAPDGMTIGFPALIDNLALFYNKTVFDKAGIPYPTEDWTWDNFRAAARKMTDPATNTYGFGIPVDGSESSTWQLWPLLWQLGGEVLSEDSTKSAFASPAGVKALDLLRGMAVDDKSVYLDQTHEKFNRLFYANQIGMMMGGPWYLYDLDVAKTSYGVVQLPAFDGKHTTVAGPDLWTLFDHQDANRAHWSYELIKWLTDPEQNARWNIKLGNLPLRGSERNLPEYKEVRQRWPAFDVIVDNFVNATEPRPTVAGYPALSSAVAEGIAQALQGAASSKEALEAAAVKADQALADS